MTENSSQPQTTLTERIARGDVGAAKCPSRDILRHVTSLWGVLVFIALREGTLRFSELRRRTDGISEKMLAQTLRQLERDGFVVRTAHPVVPPHVEYALTPLGQDVAPLVAALADWVEVHYGNITAAQRQYDTIHDQPAP